MCQDLADLEPEEQQKRIKLGPDGCDRGQHRQLQLVLAVFAFGQSSFLLGRRGGSLTEDSGCVYDGARHTFGRCLTTACTIMRICW